METRFLKSIISALTSSKTIEVNLPDGFASFESKNAYEISENKLTIEGKNIVFSFVNPDAIDAGERYYLTNKIKAPVDIDRLKVTLILDEGFVAREIYPQAQDIESDGQKIMITWQFVNFTAGSSLPIFVIFENVKTSSYLLWILVGLLIIAIVFVVLRKRKEKIIIKARRKKTGEKIEEVERYLLDNEKKVVQELGKDKELWQKQLQLRTGLSKVKLSRVLKNLEARGLIKKINFGKTNKILLKK